MEECARRGWDAGRNFDDAVRAALRYYRERVERPLRDALDALLEQGKLREYVRAAQQAEIDAMERAHNLNREVARLRGELAAANEREHPVTTAPQPTDEERLRWVEALRSDLYRPTRKARERIATLLESPTPARKSIGRRMAYLDNDGMLVYTEHPDYPNKTQLRTVLCDLVPVEGEEP